MSAGVAIAPLDLADRPTAERVLRVQRRAYRVEAALIGHEGIPPLTETLEQLQECRETFAGAFADGVLVGFVSWRVVGGTLDLHRLAIDPAHARRGIGRALLRHALGAHPQLDRAIVQTGAANAPAARLYESEGFDEVGRDEPVPGLVVTRFELRRPPPGGAGGAEATPRPPDPRAP
jgi:ribosomal protein S18 acetylase RimI-like enzyme